MKKPPLELLITLLVFVVLCGIACISTTTGDNGDSILHYLYSHEAFRHPELFLNHWAKPLFVLLSSPFARSGFKGIEIFNCGCAALTALLTFYTARRLQIKHPYLVVVLIFFSPLYFKLVFSGLTEYLFALLLTAGIYASSRKKHITAAVLISFLPLARSEGLIIIGVFALYYLLNKNFKALLFLLSGQLIYSLAGAFFYKDLLWVFNKIPYANVGSPYGHGQLTDMTHRLNYVIEKPVYLLLALGMIIIFYNMISTKLKDRENVQWLLIGCFLAFFAAHSLFWWLGIFNSMGLPRVFISIVPVIALIAAEGVCTITEKINNPIHRIIIITVTTVVICLYPFTPRRQGVIYNSHLFEVPGNAFISAQLLPYLEKEFPDHAKRRLYYNAPYLSMALHADHFDPAQHKDLHHILYDTDIPSSAVVIWDEWFSVTESGISLAEMQANPHFEQVKFFEDVENNRPTHYAIFTVKKQLATFNNLNH